MDGGGSLRLLCCGRAPGQLAQGAAPAGAHQMGHQMGHLEAAIITDVNLGLRAIGAKSLVRVAEARGFEPRMGVNPNRISSAAP